MQDRKLLPSCAQDSLIPFNVHLGPSIYNCIYKWDFKGRSQPAVTSVVSVVSRAAAHSVHL